jgi:hypothetical protein
MVATRTKARIARWHRWMGLVLTFPLVGWIVSSAAMMLVTMNAEQGLAGKFELNPFNSSDLPLQGAQQSPNEILARLSRDHGVDRIQWLRLESRGPHLLYVAKPTPYALAMTFDARTGERLDPLDDELLLVTANEALIGTRAERLVPVQEYNRYYDIDRVPAVEARMVGEQPASLIISRDEGRTLRRTNADAAQFTWWYKTFHVNQWTDNMFLWTTVLYLLAAGVVVLVAFGYQLFWWRRNRLIPVEKLPRFTNRHLHRKLGVLVGGILVVQVVVGSYMWLSLGPLEDPFRGKGSFNPAWSAGFPTTTVLAEPAGVLERVAAEVRTQEAHPVQSITWRRLGDRDAWLVSPRRDEMGVVFDAGTGARIERLQPEAAGAIAQQEVVGQPDFTYLGEGRQLWMDLNRPVPTYRFRFADPGGSDVYVEQASGQIIQRRPAFWRMFGPFLTLHMFSFTGNSIIDMSILALFQIGVLALIVTGWRLQFSRTGGGASQREAGAAPAEESTEDISFAGAES